MKKLYSFLTSTIPFLLLLYAQASQAQCAGGVAGGTTAYDTTIRFATGATNMQVKFPKFNPQTGVLSCVKLIVTLVGVVDSVAMQNYSGSPQTADFYYDRSDFMNGPGLTPSLSNSFSGHYGTYSLSGFDGIPGVGGDFHSISKDTVLKKVMTRTLTDSTEISQFYGPDSVAYNYNINVITSAAITGGSSSSLVLTSAFVNFRFEYCTCPMSVLSIGLKNFSATKADEGSVSLKWEAENGIDNYFYEVEMSRDGRRFSKVDVVNKNSLLLNPAYQYIYALKGTEYGRYYFRIKQRWFDGYYRYTDVKVVDFSNPSFTSVSVYPNPSSGNVGLKFVSAKAGKYLVQISNVGGQIVASKEIVVAETDYKAIAALQKGTYYIKITEQASQSSIINQLMVQ